MPVRSATRKGIDGDKDRVVVGRMLPGAGLRLIGERFTIDGGGDRPGREWLLDHVRGAAAIIAEPAIPVDAALLNAAGETLKVVSNFGVSSDNIDLDAVRARGVRATNTPGVLTSSTGARRRAEAGGRPPDRRGGRHRPPRPLEGTWT